jgi:DNA invertase Pin-like site-specific DNA recombinase
VRLVPPAWAPQRKAFRARARAPVPQSLDTTDLHGRLALNLLTWFAQFERELIGERSREKRAATRRQGV